jgi:hypothetical protein
MRASCAALALALAAVTPACGDPALDALVAAYPDHLAAYDEEDLIWRDGSHVRISDGRSNRLSVHAYGVATDLATKFGDYWLWSKGEDGKITWRNRIPLEIVDIFERTGFIWGGKWYHFTPSTLNTVPRSLRSPSKTGGEISGRWPSRSGLLLPEIARCEAGSCESCLPGAREPMNAPWSHRGCRTARDADEAKRQERRK